MEERRRKQGPGTKPFSVRGGVKKKKRKERPHGHRSVVIRRPQARRGGGEGKNNTEKEMKMREIANSEGKRTGSRSACV